MISFLVYLYDKMVLKLDGFRLGTLKEGIGKIRVCGKEIVEINMALTFDAFVDPVAYWKD